MWGWCTGSGGGWMPWGGGGWLPGLFGLLVLAAIVWVVVTGGRRSDPAHKQGARADRDDALRILKRRLASGEISLEEYERLRQAVES